MTSLADKLEQSPVHEGDVLAGKYRVERLLGAGGMGVVAAARHLDLNELRAVKFLLPEAKSETETVERFMREARAVVKMKNRHVVKVYDIGRFESGEPYIVMEYLEGRDLKSLLREVSTLSVEEALRIAFQTLEAIAEAHSLGIVHRDLKPANIFLTRDLQGELCVKVLDFGISKLLNVDEEGMEMTTTHALMGSPYYMSPEQMMSTRDVDTRADVWSIGVVLYQMLAGRVPFRGKNIAAQCALLLQKTPPLPSSLLGAPLPPGLDEAVLGFLRRDLEERYATVGDAAAALAPFATGGERAAKRVASVLRRSETSISHGSLDWSKSSARQERTEGDSKAPVSDDALTISTSGDRNDTTTPESQMPTRSWSSDPGPEGGEDLTRVSSPTLSDSGRSRPRERAPSDPREAAIGEAMSQSTKASWHTISDHHEVPKTRRTSFIVGAAVVIGVVLIGSAVALRSSSTTTAGDRTTTPAASPAVSQRISPESPASPAPPSPGTAAASSDPAASDTDPAATAPTAAASGPAMAKRPRSYPKPTSAPRKVAPPPAAQPPDAQDPFEGREPLR